MSNSVSTPLYIGGKARETAQQMAIADPAKPALVVGHAASATTQDVSDAVAAAKAAYPAWAALSPQKRAEKMLDALAGIAENRDADAAILSQENGKVRFEGWVDSLVLELRWKLALSHADEVNALVWPASDHENHGGHACGTNHAKQFSIVRAQSEMCP